MVEIREVGITTDLRDDREALVLLLPTRRGTLDGIDHLDLTSGIELSPQNFALVREVGSLLSQLAEMYEGYKDGTLSIDTFSQVAQKLLDLYDDTVDGVVG